MPEEFTLESLAEAMNANPENAQPDEPEAQSGEPVEPDEQQNQQDNGDPEADPSEPDESDPDDPDGQPEEPELSDDRVVKWKTADGAEHEVTEKDLRDGYMRQQDYTQKTQTLAREREKAVSEIQEQAQKQLGVVKAFGGKIAELHTIDSTLASLESEMTRINRQDDPAQFAAMQTQILTLQRQRDNVAGVLGQAEQLMQAQQMEVVKQQQQKTAELLASEMPDFGPDLLKKWNTTAIDYGFSPDELSQVTDPRVFRMLSDATKFRDLQSRKPEAVTKAKAAPPKPVKQTRSVPPTSIDKAFRQAKANTTVESVAALMSQLK